MVAATIHRAALEELAQATAFYEGRAPGLGREFFEEVQRVLVVIRQNPSMPQEFEPPYRRVFCRRFPFGVVCPQTSRGVRILALMHQRRQPGYWKRRG